MGRHLLDEVFLKKISKTLDKRRGIYYSEGDMNILLTANVLIAALQLSVLVLFILRVRAIYAQIVEFISPEADGKPSPLALVVDAISSSFSRSITAQIKTSLMGKASGDARAATAIEADIAQDMAVKSNPLIATLLNSFPSVRKTLRRNPELFDLAVNSIKRRNGSFPELGTKEGNHEQTSFGFNQ